MDFKDWTTLKTANKVAFKKIAAVAEVDTTFNADGSVKKSGTPREEAYTVLEKKVYHPDTGVESTIEKKLSLEELEQKKTELTAEKTKIQAELTEVGKMITAIKKV
jgi:hypothetical protein